MSALPPATQQTRLEEQPAGSTADAPTDLPCHPRSLTALTDAALV